MDTVAEKLCEAAEALRSAQRRYMADRGNDDLGRRVARAAKDLDKAIQDFRQCERLTQ
jgi:uncharacterized protein (DUF2384 family)